MTLDLAAIKARLAAAKARNDYIDRLGGSHSGYPAIGVSNAEALALMARVEKLERAVAEEREACALICDGLMATKHAEAAAAFAEEPGTPDDLMYVVAANAAEELEIGRAHV